jgi:hypothetical protein
MRMVFGLWAMATFGLRRYYPEVDCRLQLPSRMHCFVLLIWKLKRYKMKPKMCARLADTPKFQWSNNNVEATETIPEALRRTVVACGVPEFEISFVAAEALSGARESYPEATDEEITAIACGMLF